MSTSTKPSQLDRLKRLRDKCYKRAAAISAKIIEIEEADDASGYVPESVRWQDQLVFDFNVSGSSPVIKGTRVTVSSVISKIVDGNRWSDILRDHPELTEDDIRVCVAYTIEHDGIDP